MSMRKMVIAVALAAVVVTPAEALTVVYDPSAVAEMVKQVTEAKKQLEQLQQQVQEAQKLYNSVNKLTNMGDIASVLNDPAVRNALPASFADLEGALKGQGDGAANFKSEATVYEAPGNDFYAKELNAGADRNAGQLSVAQEFYDAATKRIDGIKQLQEQIGQADEQAEKEDLQARLQVELAFLAIDQQRLQAIAMVQAAQVQVAQQRENENWRKRVDEMGQGR